MNYTGLWIQIHTVRTDFKQYTKTNLPIQFVKTMKSEEALEKYLLLEFQFNAEITLSCYYWITEGEKVNNRKLASAFPQNNKLPSIVSATP